MRKLLTIVLVSLMLGAFAYAGNVSVLDLSAKHYFNVADNGSNELDVTGDFTVEAWVKWGGATAGRLVVRNGVFRIYPSTTDHSLRFDLTTGGVISTGAVPLNTWFHVAVSRSGSTTRIFLDGVEKTSYNFALVASTEAIYIGGQSSWFAAWDAKIDEFRFSNIARYTTTFTPPSEAFTNDANTVLLYHFDDDTQLPPGNSSSLTFTHTNNGIVQGDYLVDAELALPITLASFTATARNGAVELVWETATETNNSNFIVYRNGEAIATVAGAGTTTEPQSYSYIDNNVVPGVTYTYVLADVNYANEETRYNAETVTVTIANDIIEADFVIGAAYPNPFNPTTIVPLELAQSATVKASLYDLNGREIRALVNASFSAGSHDLHIDGTGMTTGIYLVKIVVENVVNVQRISLVK
ncbi:MAG: T9SS type A sorting domain-containing protein [Deltaproteobacteria bacterium]|nr:T9SS type A sorting domain-containing protein [Deltaproteobacteria bacterium]